jgi:hypothetical protein
MANQSIMLKASGLHTNFQSLMEVPPGALLQAKNIVINRDGIIESRRGLDIFAALRSATNPDNDNQYTQDSLIRAKQLFEYKKNILVHASHPNGGDYLFALDDTFGQERYSPVGSSVFPSIDPITEEPIAAQITAYSSDARIRSEEAKGNFYFTTSKGVKKISSKDEASFEERFSVEDSGVPRAASPDAYISYPSSGFLTRAAAGPIPSKVAYRILWTYTDNNSNLLFGAPSSRIVVSNTNTSADLSVMLNISVPKEIFENTDSTYYTKFKYRIYRSEILQSTTADPSDELYQVFEGTLPSNLGGGTAPYIGYVKYLDTISETARLGGVPLYTNANSGEGILKANEVPPACRDISAFKGHMFYANTKTKDSFTLTLSDLSKISTNGDFVITDGTQEGTDNYKFISQTRGVNTLTIVTGALATYSGRWFTLNTANNAASYAFWFDITGSTTIPPAGIPTSSIPIRTNIFNAAPTVTTIRDAIVSTINTASTSQVIEFSAVASSTNIAVITNTGLGSANPGTYSSTELTIAYSTSTAVRGSYTLTFNSAIPNDYAGRYVTITAANFNLTYVFWFDHTGVASSPPSTGLFSQPYILVRVNISGLATTTAIAGALNTAINTFPVEFSSTSPANVLTLNYVNTGATSIPTYTGTTGQITRATVQDGFSDYNTSATQFVARLTINSAAYSGLTGQILRLYSVDGNTKVALWFDTTIAQNGSQPSIPSGFTPLKVNAYGSGSPTGNTLAVAIFNALQASPFNPIFTAVNPGTTSVVNIQFSSTTGLGLQDQTPFASFIQTRAANTGTVSQSGNQVTGVGTNFNSSMVGSTLIYNSGRSAGTIVAVSSTTLLTVSTTQTVISQTYSIENYPSPGTISQLGLQITGVGTNFNSSMLGATVVYSDGTIAGTITAVSSTTLLTVTNSFIRPTNQTYTITDYPSTGTASQLGTQVTGVGTNFNSSMIGSTFTYANGLSSGIITAVSSTTLLTVSVSQSVASQSYFVTGTFSGAISVSNFAGVINRMLIGSTVEETARNMVRAINFKENSKYYATYLSNFGEIPGKIFIEKRVFDNLKFIVCSKNDNTRRAFSPTIGLAVPNSLVTSSTNKTKIVTDRGIWGSAFPNTVDDVFIFGVDYTLTGTPSGPSSLITSKICGAQKAVAYGSNFEWIYQNVFEISGVTDAISSPAAYFNTGYTVFLNSLNNANLFTSSSEVIGNRLYFSKFQEHEAVPLLNYIDIGSRDQQILRIVQLRESLFVLKEDGVYRLAGDPGANPIWDVGAFDTTAIIKAPDTAITLGNQCYFLSNQGIMQLNESSIQSVSRSIDNKLLPLITTNSNLPRLSFSVSYESDKSFLMWTVSTAKDTKTTICYRYNYVTNAWTEWTLSKTCGIVSVHDDKMYIGSSTDNYIEVERKQFNRFDFADRELTGYTLTSGALGDSTITNNTLFTTTKEGDVCVQTQYVSFEEFNRLLSTLDYSYQTNSKDYLQTLRLSKGDDLYNNIVALMTKLQTSEGFLFSSYSISFPVGSESLEQLQSKYNEIIYVLRRRFDNLDSIINFSANTYNNTVEYSTGDIVQYSVDGNYYRYIQNTPSTGNLPTDTTFWESYTPTLLPPAYNNSTAYQIGNLVSFTGDTYYRCIANSTGNLPTNVSFWQPYTPLVITELKTLNVGFTTLLGYVPKYKLSSGSRKYEAMITGLNKVAKLVEFESTPSFMIGPFTVLQSIPVEIEYAPQHTGDPASSKQFSVGTLIFEKKSFAGAQIAYNSDISDNYEEVPVDLNSYSNFGAGSWGEGTWGGSGDQSQLRTYIPLKKQRCRFLGCKFIHSGALEFFSLYGLSLSYRVYMIPDRDFK